MKWSRRRDSCLISREPTNYKNTNPSSPTIVLLIFLLLLLLLLYFYHPRSIEPSTFFFFFFNVLRCFRQTVCDGERADYSSQGTNQDYELDSGVAHESARKGVVFRFFYLFWLEVGICGIFKWELGFEVDWLKVGIFILVGVEFMGFFGIQNYEGLIVMSDWIILITK